MDAPLIVPPKTILQIVIDNHTGQVEFKPSAPVPFPQLVAIFCQLLTTFASQAAQQQAAPRLPAPPSNGVRKN